jgi:hypothetical protein
MHRITEPDATIIAAAADPYKTSDPVHLSYQQLNRTRGRMAGQLRLRIRYRQYKGPWFDYLFASAAELQSIVAKTDWTVNRVVQSQGPEYVAILKKSKIE